MKLTFGVEGGLRVKKGGMIRMGDSCVERFRFFSRCPCHNNTDNRKNCPNSSINQTCPRRC